MLDIINSILRCNDYYICLYNNHIYLYNYIEILSFNNDLIMVKYKDFNIKIKGDNLKIVHISEKELIISGRVYGVNYE